MTIVIGVDEAGYGPNLGPLVIGASAWQIDDSLTWEELSQNHPPFANVNAEGGPADRRSLNRDATNLLLGDSKQLYKPRQSLRPLELPCLSIAASLQPSLHHILSADSSPTDADNLMLRHGLLSLLDEQSREEAEGEHWWEALNGTWPIDCEASQVLGWAKQIKDGTRQCAVRPVALEAVAVCPGSFNRQLDEGRNKATLLSETSLQLLLRLLDRFPGESVVCLCDRHGGRKDYRRSLQQANPSALVQVVEESTEISRYRWLSNEVVHECHFITRGERYMPVALASMLAKYVRELSMKGFNQYWQTHLPDLSATAGYPVDAKRFRLDVEEVRRKLRIPDQHFWRRK